ncbi:acyl-CoA desaturase [Nocardiopsis sp. RSe5-2]|uniref:Acyl-CoA desaturase n=1 Tax=Nocardiopsis endophytica TaxID=3018445 RepID=A0ABT4TXZ3_9ACTN|nr:acyl-CoA desaturase [Nocardiopsis endophytica]MDA2809564.1 acyl-CoA desaturase [Nocardiopsis endophytica]
MERTPRYFAVRLTLTGAAYAAAWAAFALVGDSWWQLATAVALAAVFGQVALVAHELAHRQIFSGRRLSENVGLFVGNLGIGLGYAWWQDKHTRHHANPNHEELDPDVQPEILVWSQDQARAAKGLPRLLGRSQAYLFYPLLLLEGLNLHVGSVRALFRPATKRKGAEAALLAAHFVLYLAAVFLVLDPVKAVAFIAVQQGLFGVYLGCIFAPNHKGMPTLKKGEKLDFLRKQVLTSRNVRGGWFTDIALGGLNYQIEHHLFPSMPGPNLRRAQPIVRAYCEEIGVPYHETGFIRSHAEALAHLHRAGEPIREAA